MPKFYVSKGYVGNCLLFWRKGGHGYSSDLKDAEVFDGDNPKLSTIIKDGRYSVWVKEYVDNVSCLHVDSEYLNIEKHEEFLKRANESEN